MNTDEKLTQVTKTLKYLTAFVMNQTNNSKFSPAHKDALTTLEPTTVVPANRSAPPLDGGESYLNWWHVDPQTQDQIPQNSMSSSSRHNSKDT